MYKLIIFYAGQIEETRRYDSESKAIEASKWFLTSPEHTYTIVLS